VNMKVDSGRHQAAIVDIPLCDHRRRNGATTPLVGLLLHEDSNLGFLYGNIGLSHANRCLLRLQGQAIIVTLLKREPSLRDELAIAPRV